VRTVRIVNLDNAQEIAARAAIAGNPWTRGRGLLGRRSLPEGEGLLIESCRQIHMFFMAFAIDVLHVKRISPTEGEVTRVLHAIAPNRIGPWVRHSDYVIELPAGTAARTGTEQGHHIGLQPAEP
jgi:uncharacterized membrane protein (UPF0127 family)